MRFTRTTGADRTTSLRLQRRKRSRRDGGWGSLSARRSRFPTPPARSPLAPESSREPNLALLRSPPLPCLSYPLWLYIEPPPPPYVPIPRGSSERMFCHHTTPHAVLPPAQLPEQPPQSPSILFPHSLSFALPPSQRPSAPRRRGRYTRNHVHTSNFRFRYPKCSLCTCTYAFRRRGGLISTSVRARIRTRMTMQEGAKAHRCSR